MAQYWINSIDWECEQNLPEETEIMDGLHYPFIIEAPENASEKDIIRALYDKQVGEDVEVNVEGFYEFSIAGVDYEPVEKNKAGQGHKSLEDKEYRKPKNNNLSQKELFKKAYKWYWESVTLDGIDENDYKALFSHMKEKFAPLSGANINAIILTDEQEPVEESLEEENELWAEDAKAKAADENFGLERESDFRELEEEVEDITTELMESLQTDFRDLKDLVRRGDKRQDLVVQLIRKHLIPNLKELADLLDQSKAG